LRKVDSGQVNQYIKDNAAHDFTTKDFRTWAGTLMMLRILKQAPCETISDQQKNIIEAFRQVSDKLGNTISVCKKYYVHPQLVIRYQQNQLSQFFGKEAEIKENGRGLTAEESILMKILKAIQREQAKPRPTERLLKASIKKEIQKNRKRVLAA
jgi:DNA topoisomerase I